MQKNNKENNERKSEKKDIINNKIIHYCWFGGKPLSKLTQKCIKSWKKYLPDFEIKQWNETNVDLNECQFIKQAYEQKKWAFVADYTRFKALEQYGGLYLDTDMEITADISKYLQNDFFVGKEDSNMANAAVVWVKNKQDKHIKEILKIYKSYDKFNQTGDIYAVSVPRILSNYLEKYGFDRKNDNIQKLDEGTIYVYPMEYFYPLSYDYQHNKFTKNSCMIHHFDATWASGYEKMTLFLRRHKLTFLFSIWKFFSVVKYKIERIISRIKLLFNNNEKELEMEKEYKKYKKLDKFLYFSSFMYLLIPIIILLIFWFKWYISSICIVFILISYCFCIKNLKYKTFDEYKKIFNYKKIIIFLAFIVIINLISGAGGIFLQNWDYKGRNAILHDLIEKKWPVKYDYTALKAESNIIGSNYGVLSYYFAYWLPAGLIGKIFSFNIANVFLLLWQIIGTALFFYLLFRKIGNIKLHYFLVFICFSGLDIIGRVILNLLQNNWISPFGTAHIDTWNGLFCLSSFITQLFWVFNQSIPAWIATTLLLNEKNYKSYGFIIALLLPFSPFPEIGLILIVFMILVYNIFSNQISIADTFKRILTIQNIFAVLSVVPVGLLFMQNSSEKGFIIKRTLQNTSISKILVLYVLYLLFEVFPYFIILNKKNKNVIIGLFVILAGLPLFYIGGGVDLGNRATIPALVILYYELLKFIDENKNIKRKIVLAMILSLTFCTNFNEIYRSFKYVITYKKAIYVEFNDPYKTFSQFKGKECETFIKNFVAKYDNNKFYYKYILK